MATIVNNPASNDSGGGMGFFIGIILLIAFGFLFFIYGLPYIRQGMGGEGVQVNVPKDINVNVNQTQ